MVLRRCPILTVLEAYWTAFLADRLQEEEEEEEEEEALVVVV